MIIIDSRVYKVIINLINCISDKTKIGDNAHWNGRIKMELSILQFRFNQFEMSDGVHPKRFSFVLVIWFYRKEINGRNHWLNNGIDSSRFEVRFFSNQSNIRIFQFSISPSNYSLVKWWLIIVVAIIFWRSSNVIFKLLFKYRFFRILKDSSYPFFPISNVFSFIKTILRYQREKSFVPSTALNRK